MTQRCRTSSRISGKERDSETGLDYFGARYFSAAQGRFTSPDSPFIGWNPSNPQSWNLYSYALNNPLRCVDPTGHDPADGEQVTSTIQYACAAGYTGPNCDDPVIYGSNGGNAATIMKNVHDSAGPVVNVMGVATVAAVPFAFGGAALLGLSATTAVAASTSGVAVSERPHGQNAIAAVSQELEATGVTADVTFTHFTDAAGVQGITGLNPAGLAQGQTATVSQLQFGIGQNSYLANAAGDNFVTNLPASATSGQLQQIGVFGARQGFAISFSGEAAAAQGVLVRSAGQPSIYTVPDQTVLTGCFTVVCR